MRRARLAGHERISKHHFRVERVVGQVREYDVSRMFAMLLSRCLLRSGDNERRSQKQALARPHECGGCIAQGGFGVVNAVVKETPPHSGKVFAMKSLRKHVILERNHTEMVFRERNLLARLRHPRLVNMHYAFQDEAHLYIIMDACLGGDLHYQIMQSPARRFTEAQVSSSQPASARNTRVALVSSAPSWFAGV